MTDDASSRGVRHYLRTRTRHEDDFLPVLYWFLLAHAAGFIAHVAANTLFQWAGVTGTTTVKIVGGGAVSHVTWSLSEYYAMSVQAAVLFLVFGGFCLRNWRSDYP